MTTIAAWFKPGDDTSTLFSRAVSGGTLTIRSLRLEEDLDTIHDWVNQDYSRLFWQMNGAKQLLVDTYQALLDNPATHPFVLLLDDMLVAQVDLYLVQTDELNRHVHSEANDCGLHILVMPPQQGYKGLSVEILETFIHFYFSHKGAGLLYGEPDHANAKANLLAKRVGFHFLRVVELSNKTANLYVMTKASFHANR